MIARFLLLLALPLAAQDFSQLHVEVVAHGFRFTEGPAWSRDGYLLFSEIPGGKIVKLAPESEPATFRQPSEGAAGNTFDAQGRLYTCETRARRITRTA